MGAIAFNRSEFVRQADMTLRVKEFERSIQFAADADTALALSREALSYERAWQRVGNYARERSGELNGQGG